MRFAVVATLAAAALLLAGCGLGAGSQEGTVDVLATRDYGREILADEQVGDLTESETAMRVLDTTADVETRYGGGFVQSVDGLEGGTEGGRNVDWFFSVNGIVAERGSADFPVHSGDKVWWDFRDWTDAMEIGAVVGAWPAPMAGGYDEEVWPVSIECAGETAPCDKVRDRLDAAGVEATVSPEIGGSPEGSLRFLVGTWSEIKIDENASRLESKPSRSGIFARFEEADGVARLVGLDQEAGTAQDFGPDAGMVAAYRKLDGPPVWFVTGGSVRGVEQAASVLTTEDLQHRYAAVVNDGKIFSLPLP